MSQPEKQYHSNSIFEHFVPFHLTWNKAGKVLSISRRLTSFFGGLTPEEVQQEITMFEPFPSPLMPVLFPEITNVILLVGLVSKPEQVIKGELISLGPEHGWMLSGLPPARSIAELDAFGVKLSDLPLHLGVGKQKVTNAKM